MKDTTQSLAVNESSEPLSALSQRFILHWGEMGSRWGVNRTVAQIHALLFMAGRPMHAEEIAEQLSVARSNVSTSIRELMSLNLVTVVHRLGDRRDHFETHGDVWKLFRNIVVERKSREFDPTVAMLESLVADPEFGKEDDARQKRVKETLALMSLLSNWMEDMMQIEPKTLMRIMKLGSRIQKLLGKDAARNARRSSKARSKKS